MNAERARAARAHVQPDLGDLFLALLDQLQLGRADVKQTLPPRMTDDERAGLRCSAETLRDALRGLSS